MKQYLSFDFGGTFVKDGIIGEDGSITQTNKIPLPATLDDLLEHIAFVTKKHRDCEGIAISAPGAVSPDGIIYGSSAITYLHKKDNIRKLIEAKTGMPVHIENDANCVGYAEVWNGAAKGKKDVLAVVIGTSIGGAVIKDGVIHKGAHLHGGDFGYMLMNKNYTSENDIWSRVASTSSLIRKVAELKKCDPSEWSGETIFESADAGDSDCQQALDEFYHYLAVGLYNLQYMFDPEVILLGGGISQQERLPTEIDRKLDALLSVIQLAKVKPNIKVCTFKQDANLLGAVYAFRKRRKRRDGSPAS
ncbi:ROK family protein [Salipaludibacillus sp. HK11]|uniref:ROK family protein n=1 Tax=Salipaludibacillus sp. HK11 TaxID=3394320 RepID=UPI0039FDA6FB